MIDDCPTFLDLVMKLGREGAEDHVLEQVYHGEEIQTRDDDENG